MSADDHFETFNLHGTAVAVGGRAVLIRGRSGAGKSDLALRTIALTPRPLIAHQPVLVADDRVLVTNGAAGLRVTCPDALQGLIEVRGVGIVHVPFLAAAALVLVADLADPMEPMPIERLPEPLDPAYICGRPVPRVLIAPFEASAPLKLLLALAAAGPA